MRGADLLARGTATLTQAGVPDAGRDARRLLAHVLKVPPGRLTLFLPEEVEPQLTVIFNAMIERRADRVPVSHLTGRRLFYGREFIVTRDVLDPRPETETLIEAALSQPFVSVLDLGTGSGCILLTLLMEREDSWGIGTDLSREALDVAFWNRNALRLEPRAALELGSWFAPLEDIGRRFDLIVSNPPYIAADEMPGLAPELRDHEPRMALTDEADGLTAYREIAARAPEFLEPGGRLLLEIGATQGRAVAGLLRRAGFDRVRVIPDLDGRPRVVSGVRIHT
ncbi:peptide chain release factor N(5)-glutamine methyltransferase [Thalassococcus sp. CAU 1522]|uniref:Release factor glutamine methyltransferase n=1 Tax=Thalassococcus arenae TaxID=2851652 RepID=A0ABS6NBG9_9RHOB|nr:peptide chain release factor N(5)-glutamine methyltransferase [Thalassococcus arenae]MBV2361354.1 peptide chain release factor N(5)-glutamine methyltransferase [Thalassococcus arenae]